MEHKLKKSQEQLKLILSSLKDLVFVISQDYKILFVNKSAVEKFEKELTGKLCYSIIKGIKLPCDFCPMKTFAESNVSQVRFEQCINFPSTNETNIFDIISSPIENYDGKPAIIEILRDITEQAKEKDEFRKLNAYNRNLIEASLDPLVTIDPDGKIMDVNRATETITGRSREELIGTDFLSYFTKPKKASEGYKKVFETGSVQDYELNLQHVDGHVTQVLYNASVFKDEDGNVSGVFATARDITEKKKTEQKLKKSEKWLSITLRSIGYAVIATDNKGNINFMNPVTESLTGWKQDEALGKELKVIFNIINEKTGARVQNPVSRVLREGIIIGLANDTILIRKDGKKILIADSGAPIRDDEGNIMGVILVFRDITERKKAEEEKIRLTEELAIKEKLAFLGEISVAVGHELRNPLTAIKNNIYYLSMILENPTEDLSETLKYINEDIARMNKIILDLLDYSRIKTLERRSVNVNKLIEDLLLRSNIPENITVDKNFQENISKIFVDGLRFEQILINIINNAFEAMESGGKLTIVTSQVNYEIEIQIKDTGCGIESNNLEKIFEPFYTTKVKGIGLGLGITKRLIEAHDGTISVQSQIGKGTTFKLKFPLIKKNINTEGIDI